MNFLNQSPSQRILSWRDFRKEIENCTEEEQLEHVASFWNDLPIIKFSIDWDKADTWPTAWELIHEGNFDSSAIGYLMEQTLIMLGWKSDRLLLSYIKDSKVSDQMMVLIVDNKHVLNYSWGEVFPLSNIKDQISFMIKYRWLEDHHEEV